jgi:hypothetical protein
VDATRVENDTVRAAATVSGGGREKAAQADGRASWRARGGPAERS